MDINNRIVFIAIFVLINGCVLIDIDRNKHVDSLATVSFVDIDRFMGEWYVIANIPTFIEKDAVNSIESYSINKFGEIEITFSFNYKDPNGKKKTYHPKGFIYNRETNAEWRMQFFWPFKSPFLIIDIDKNYEYTVIGYPNRKYVWIMCRKPEMDRDLYESIIKRLKLKGYDISKIKKVIQVWNNK